MNVFEGVLLRNVLPRLTRADKRIQPAVAKGWGQSWNVDGLDVLLNSSGLHFLVLVTLEQMQHG